MYIDVKIEEIEALLSPWWLSPRAASSLPGRPVVHVEHGGGGGLAAPPLKVH